MTSKKAAVADPPDEELDAADPGAAIAEATDATEETAAPVVCAWCGKTPYDGDEEKLRLLLDPGEDVSAPLCIHCGHNPR